jgi:hypothetical protein
MFTIIGHIAPPPGCWIVCAGAGALVAGAGALVAGSVLCCREPHAVIAATSSAHGSHDRICIGNLLV